MPAQWYELFGEKGPFSLKESDFLFRHVEARFFYSCRGSRPDQLQAFERVLSIFLLSMQLSCVPDARLSVASCIGMQLGMHLLCVAWRRATKIIY